MTTGLPGYENAPRRSPRSAVAPHSASVSRNAASSRVSPRSTCPPGNVQRPRPGSIARLTRRTRSPRTMRMPAAIFGSIQCTTPQRTQTGTFLAEEPTACSSSRAAHCVQKIGASYTASGYPVSRGGVRGAGRLGLTPRPLFDAALTRGREVNRIRRLLRTPSGPEPSGRPLQMILRKWTDDDARWLKANFGRMDLQTLSKELGLPLEDLEKKIRQMKLAAPEPDRPRKAPASLKEAVKETSAARKEYEKAIELFHKRHFDEAARRFEDLIEKHPDEKEFLDRARMYLGACRTGKKTKGPSMAEPEELYYAAVFEKNRGNVDKALELLRKNAGRRDGDGRVHYLAACCFALQDDAEQALQSLRKAIAADDQNRIQARLEADLAPLRGTQGFTELVAGGA